MAQDTKSILLVGVGGQGTILASKILSQGLLHFGFDVKMSEIHGMSQRGGSVTTHVRFGKKVDSPIISKGSADILVAFEKVEAARYLDFLKRDGKLIVNNYEIYSLPVITGVASYPEDVTDKLKTIVNDTKVFNAFELADKLGNSKAQNIVLLGALVAGIGLAELDWNSVLEELIPEKMLDLNKKAFELGLTL